MHEEWISNKEDKMQQAVSFLDLSAAFDTISKDIISQKLKVLGFDQMVQLISVRKNSESYDREFNVR